MLSHRKAGVTDLAIMAASWVCARWDLLRPTSSQFSGKVSLATMVAAAAFSIKYLSSRAILCSPRCTLGSSQALLGLLGTGVASNAVQPASVFLQDSGPAQNCGGLLRTQGSIWATSSREVFSRPCKGTKVKKTPLLSSSQLAVRWQQHMSKCINPLVSGGKL